jgi:hypothetical protein
MSANLRVTTINLGLSRKGTKSDQDFSPQGSEAVLALNEILYHLYRLTPDERNLVENDPSRRNVVLAGGHSAMPEA